MQLTWMTAMIAFCSAFASMLPAATPLYSTSDWLPSLFAAGLIAVPWRIMTRRSSRSAATATAFTRTLARLIAAEVARGQAVVEHAGTAQAAALDAVSAALSRKYGRAISWVAKRNDALIAGLRIRVGDDVYESSVAGQLATLARSV